MTDELIALSACQAVRRLEGGEVSPLELIDAAAERVAEVDTRINALPTLCLDRARAHAVRLMAGDGREAAGEPVGIVGIDLEGSFADPGKDGVNDFGIRIDGRLPISFSFV